MAIFRQETRVRESVQIDVMTYGDQIYVMRPLMGLTGVYEHHGIDCGDGTVIHYRKIDEATIAQTSLSEFAMGNRIFVKRFPVSFIPDVVVERAESRLGEQQYNLLSNNCEHFATWCSTGYSQCQQLDSFGAGVGGISGSESESLIVEAAQTGNPIEAVRLFDEALSNIAIAQRHLQPQYNQAQVEINTWHRVAQLALKRDREDLARAALERKVAAKRAADDFQTQLEQLGLMQRSIESNRQVAQQKLTGVV
jgi:Lecithin retinol acyltransferase